MADIYLVNESNLIKVADSIREKGGTVNKLNFPDEFVFAIQNLQTESNPLLQEKTVSPAKTQQIVNSDEGYDGLSSVTIEGVQTYLQHKTATLSTSSASVIEADSNKLGLASVTVPQVLLQSKSMTVSNGNKSATVTPDSGYIGLSSVTARTPAFQYYEGSFTPSSGSATVYCGFKPDVIWMQPASGSGGAGYVYSSGYYYQSGLCVFFNPWNTTYTSVQAGSVRCPNSQDEFTSQLSSNRLRSISMLVRQTSTGFVVSQAQYSIAQLGSDYFYGYLPNTMDFCAIKYTT